MALKLPGGLFLTVCATVQACQCIFLNCAEKGESNGKGLVASGPVSFGKIYSTLNEILRRGGIYKNGAVVLHLDYDHADLFDFITASRA